ncbi:MAG TPA: DNA polymerase III subunit epsilon [Stellaceae bacterium]|nr:DNA polymerase III subunit epsilon [Stellaceae bacterium]
MREIILDTETTGLDPASGDRVVEIAAIELFNLMPTGREFHIYINPERDMPIEAFEVHGLSAEFLAGHPTFAPQAADFVEFMAGDRLVAHNAEFDVRFLNAELTACGLPVLASPVQDTLQMARRKFPGAPASLDALCRRFAIDLSERSRHGALIDCRLLARVYLELMGGAQPVLSLISADVRTVDGPVLVRQPRAARPHQAMAEELAAHQALLDGLTNPVWRQ